jgi:Fe2+ transport system protein FeoA
MTISIINGVNPLQTTLLELGIVSGRVALLLRSAEIQPVFGRFSI